MSEAPRYVLSRPAVHDMQRLDESIRRRVFAALDRLVGEHIGDVRKLADRDEEYRLRVGDYRVLYRLDVTRHVLVVTRVLPRGRAYRP